MSTDPAGVAPQHRRRRRSDRLRQTTGRLQPRGARLRVAERFPRRRSTSRAAGWRRLRGVVSLVVLAGALGAALAMALAGVAALIAYLLHQATNG
ncbi:MAG: hypothetical protein ACR2NJ_13200 [Acidimicrobiales bacterium]